MNKKRSAVLIPVCAALILFLGTAALNTLRPSTDSLLLDEIHSGEHTYRFFLSSSEERLSLGKPSTTRDKRTLRDRTEKVYPIYAGNTPVGTITLTTDKTDSGYVFYLASDAPAGTQVLIKPPAAHDLTVRPVSLRDTQLHEPQALSQSGASFGQDTALYFEGGISLYISRPAVLTGLGQTVYVRERPARGVSVTFPAAEPLISIQMGSERGSTAAAWGVLTMGTLLDWDAGAPAASRLDNDTETCYFLRADGVYLAMPDSYRPYQHDADEGQTHIYRTSAAWLIDPVFLAPPGDLFRAIAASTVYSYTDAVNASGFIPTYPSSTWLSSEYSIGQDFYDTRFNTDTIRNLMDPAAAWDEPLLLETAEAMLAHYLRHRARNAFEVQGVSFVPDYADAHGMQQGAACSLNHYLAEGLALLCGFEACGRQDFWDAGIAVLNAIDASASWWIRENGDLWYAIRPDGEMEKDDYVSVTYNDLIDACRLLSKFDIWRDYPGIQRLLDSKEQWMAAQGHSHLLIDHAPFTYK